MQLHGNAYLLRLTGDGHVLLELKSAWADGTQPPPLRAPRTPRKARRPEPAPPHQFRALPRGPRPPCPLAQPRRRLPGAHARLPRNPPPTPPRHIFSGFVAMLPAAVVPPGRTVRPLRRGRSTTAHLAVMNTRHSPADPAPGRGPT